MNRRAGKKFRISRRRDISRLFDSGKRAWDGLITLHGLPNDLDEGISRVAVAVSVHHGKAVRRNRIKRLCREAFRLVRAELPAGWDYVIVPRRGADLTTAGLQDSLRKLAVKIASRASSEDEET